MVPWSTVARADVAAPGPPPRGRIGADLPPPEAPPGEAPGWVAPAGVLVLALLLGALALSRARRRAAG